MDIQGYRAGGSQRRVIHVPHVKDGVDDFCLHVGQGGQVVIGMISIHRIIDPILVLIIERSNHLFKIGKGNPLNAEIRIAMPGQAKMDGYVRGSTPSLTSYRKAWTSTSGNPPDPVLKWGNGLLVHLSGGRVQRARLVLGDLLALIPTAAIARFSPGRYPPTQRPFFHWKE